ncbi:MAG: 5-oxoprolinase subunit PxpA [Pseudomonadota bacterium]
MSKRFIDLNADMGEYADGDQQANEAALMPLISSCSIACGGHAGDNMTMRETLRLAKAHGVSVGAHPAYPDREGFGRRHLTFESAALLSSLHAQVSDLRAIAKSDGITLRHVKPHGALYNDAARNIDLANLVADAAGDAIIVGPPGSALETAARAHGRAFAAEGFVDRLYLTSGALTPRSEPGAVIADIDARANQALAIARGDSFTAAGGELQLAVKTLCIHSDSPGAVDTAKAVRHALEKDGFAIQAFA